jgi:hypothetical protein
MESRKPKRWARWLIVSALWLSCVPALWFWAFFEVMIILLPLDRSVAAEPWSPVTLVMDAGWALFVVSSPVGWWMLAKSTWFWADRGERRRGLAKKALWVAALGLAGLNVLAPFGLLASPAFAYLAAMAWWPDRAGESIIASDPGAPRAP